MGDDDLDFLHAGQYRGMTDYVANGFRVRRRGWLVPGVQVVPASAVPAKTKQSRIPFGFRSIARARMRGSARCEALDGNCADESASSVVCLAGSGGATEGAG
jgi:hypothetical protein